MLYLLQDCYKDLNGIYHDILKIGYSDKDFASSRESAYNTHNFGYQLLLERPGDKSLEKYLHNYFKKYQISTEWFIYDGEIIDGFLSIDPDDEISEPSFVKYLKSIHRRDIIDPDFLLGTDKSIEERIRRSLEIATEFWIFISNSDSEIDFDKILEDRLKRTTDLIHCVEDQKSEEYKQILLEKYKNCYSEDDYIYVSGDEDSGFNVVFDEGKYKIQKLALEIYKQEIRHENYTNLR